MSARGSSQERRSSGSSSGRTPSKPPSPQPGVKRPSLSGSAAAAAAAPTAAHAPIATRVSRPTSAARSAITTRTATGGPVKGVYRPGAATAAAAPAVKAANGSTPRTTASPTSSSSSSAAAPPARPSRASMPQPGDSDYDSDEVLSSEEDEEEQPLVHAQPQPLPFQLTRPDPTVLTDMEQLPVTELGEFKLKQQHVLQDRTELYPVTQVQMQHQREHIEQNGQLVASAGGSFNSMSFSSSHLPHHANDLLYTDVHPPFLYARHDKPLTIWLLGKPLAGKHTLAKRLQRELGHNGASVASTTSTVPPSRPHARDYTNNIPYITPEFLLAHAKESSSSPGGPVFPEIDSLLTSLSDGTALKPEVLLQLFIFALHSERVAYHGYVLADMSFLQASVAEVASITQRYPELVERGVWPPQYLIELQMEDEEVLARLQHRKTDYILQRVGDAMGFKEQTPKEPEVVEGQEAAGEGGEEGEEGAASPALSRPVSSLSRHPDEGEDGEASAPYPAYTSLHRPNDVEDYDAEEYAALVAEGYQPSTKLHQRHLYLESEDRVQQELMQYETTRSQLLQLIASWTQFHPAGSNRTLNSAQSLHKLNGALPTSQLLGLVLHLLGQNKWSSGLAVAQHLPFVAKEELRPIEEAEVRELLLLPNLNNSHPRESSTVNLSAIPLPTTNDPSGMDLETESLYPTVSHHFGVFQTYCPVSLLSEGRLVEGREEYTVSFMNCVYMMASRKHMNKFQANPLHFTFTPPSLPNNYVMAFVGGEGVGKSTLAQLFESRFGWRVHRMDGSEGAIDQVAPLLAAGGRHILDGGFMTTAQFDYAAAQGVRIDKVVYVYVEDVEVLPGRLRLAKQIAAATAPPLSQEEEEKKAAEAAEAAAAAAAAAAESSKSKKGDKKKSTGKLVSSSSSEAGDDGHPTDAEEELMDRVDEFQNEVWPNTLIQYLEEHAYAVAEINNSGPAREEKTGGASSSRATSRAPSTHTSPTLTPAPAPTSLPEAVLASIEEAFFMTRRQVDPFFNFRFRMQARKVSSEQVEKSWKDEDRVPLGPNPAGASAAAASGAVSTSGFNSDNPRGLRFGDTNYCPVCLLGPERLLVPGIAEEGVCVGVQSYSCCSSECATAFVESPDQYNLHSKEHLEKLTPDMPPLRILVTGARGSGKSHASRKLQQHFGLHYNFSLSALFYPALKELASKTLQSVLEAEAQEAARKAAEKEARRAARKAKKEAEAAARAAAGEEAADGDGSDNEDGDSDASDLSDAESDGESLSQSGDVLDLKDKDILRLYLTTDPHHVLDHAAILRELLEEEWVSHAQIESILRDIFLKHAWVDPSPAAPHDHTNVAGWVCELDLHDSILLNRVEAVLNDTANAKHAKPHVVLPMEAATRTAVGRLVTIEQARQAALPAASDSDMPESDDALSLRRNLSEKQRLKQEAQEKAAREQREKEEREAAAKAAKRGGRLKKGSAADARKAEPSPSPKAKKGKKDEEKKEEDSDEKQEDSPDDKKDGSEDGSADKSEADLAAEAEEEEKRAAAARVVEELTGTLGELHRTSLEAHDGFLAALRMIPGGVVVLEPVKSSGSAIRNESVFSAKMIAVFEAFLKAQEAGFQTCSDLSMADANKLLRNGMRALRQFGTFCPCCLLSDPPVSYDCKLSLSNRGGEEYYPVQYGVSTIVLTCSPDHRAEFKRHAKTYLRAPPPPPLLAPRILVLESVWDGGASSSALAQKVANELNLVYLTLQSILSKLSTLPHTVLGRDIAHALSQGLPLSDEQLVDALAYVVSEQGAMVHGWVLHGFPANKEQAALIKKKGIVAQEVITILDTKEKSKAAAAALSPSERALRAQREQLLSSLVSALKPLPLDGEEEEEAAPAEPTSAMSRDGWGNDDEDEEGGGAPKQLPPPPRKWGPSNLLPPGFNLEEAILTPIKASKAAEEKMVQELLAVASFYERNYHNLIRLYTGSAPATPSSAPHTHLQSDWQRAEYTLRLLHEHGVARQKYRVAVAAPTFDQSRPASIAHLGVSRAQLLAHAAPFGDYCNICWMVEGKLHSSASLEANRYTTEYKQQFYRQCSAAHQSLFLSSPTSFLSSSSPAHQLPKDLPFHVSASDAARIEAQHCELLGHCPVTLRQTQMLGEMKVVQGKEEFTVCYRHRLYRMVGQKEMETFLQLPAVYASVRLPQKMPPARSLPTHSSADLLSLGKTLAFMEKEFAALLMKGLNSFESIRSPSSPSPSPLRLKYPSLPLTSTALLYLSLFLKTHNPRNTPWLKEKFENKMKLFVEHASIIPQVAAQFKQQQAASTPKPAEESKEEQTTQEEKAQSDAPPSSLSPDAVSLLYDTLRAELRAHAEGVGSRQSLAQYFERYLR